MKEIKFRAIWQHSETGRLTTTYYTTDELLLSPMGHILVAKDMQFTNLLDKNEKEIYEGDILRTWIDGYLQKIPYIVEDMRELYNEFNRDDGYYLMHRCEIIGNIYKNPELVKKKGCEHTYTIDCQPYSHRIIHTCSKCQHSVTETLEPIKLDEAK